MIETVNFSTFCDRFFQSDNYKNNFTYDGLRALFDYLEEIEESTGEPIEFDMIGLCCEYSEYNSAKDVVSEYGAINESDSMDEEYAKEWLRDRTQVIDCENGHLIIQNF